MDLMSEDEFFHRARHVPTEQLKWNLANRKKIQVWIRRDDLIDPIISGNKFYKLFYNLHAAKNVGYRKILSFGGYYSNHLYALAAAGFKYGFDTVGVIRGERPKQFSQTLKDMQEFGMTLDFISRENYRT